LEEEAILDFVVDNVIDRVLIYTNRIQLEEEADDSEDQKIPVELETSLALVVVGVTKTVKNLEDKEIKKVDDNGQSVTYGEQIASYLSRASDTDIFLSVKGLLDNFRIPTVVKYDNTEQF
jgi:hypothetical protein